MAFSPQAMTLDVYATQSNDPVVEKFTDSLYRTKNIVKDIPLATKDTLIMLGARMDQNSALPSMTNIWTAVNQDPTVVIGKLTDYSERMFLVRAQFQIDKRINRDTNAISPPIDVQSKLFFAAFEYNFNYTFINNAHNSGGNLDAFAGLRTRLDNPGAYGMPTELKFAATGADLSPTGITAATANAFLRYVEQLLDFIMAEDGDNVVLYMNDYMRRAFAYAVRQAGPGAGFDTTTDAFDRKIRTFRGAKLRDVGRKADQTTRIISQNEDSSGNDGGTGYTSIYAVNYGTETFCGWQPEPLRVQAAGLDPTNLVRFNWVVDWGVGLWIPNNRSFARMYGIKIA